MRRIVLCLLAAMLILPATGCSINPATGKRTFTLLSREQEIALGSDAAPQFTDEFGGKVPSERLQQYVAGIGRKMAAETEEYNPDLPWEFTLLNTDVVNAFALPGGKVFFTRGLARELTSEAQMAGVLGHEIGHVTARHGNQRISQQIGFNVVLAGLAVSVAAADEDSSYRRYGQYALPALAIGGNVVLLKYGRDEEIEADALGMRYMTAVGYDPRGQLEVMQTLARLSDGPRPPEFLSTHPAPETRIERIQRQLSDEYSYTQANPHYGSFADRYQREFLDVLASLPPAPKGQARGPLDLDRPATWCGVCAAGDGRGAARAMLAAAVRGAR